MATQPRVGRAFQPRPAPLFWLGWVVQPIESNATVKRLESAIRKDSVPVGDSNTRLEKRARDESQDQELNNESNKIRAVDELKNVSIQELRKEAENRGISTSGTKKELLERLCNDIEVKPVNDLKNASIKELRKEAENRGVSTTGTKKELLERLCNGSETNTKDIVTGTCISLFCCCCGISN
ncbi:poly(ADP-ribose) polymerase [Artemisia annua]|uniref:Poly(ADP-ribose) polymerase n=1 Tax=Artemisia annua TaxID=35608 RepID=A0A2U1LMH0_ARTAN|nr:poly(ADP-ribose) polymerase [Artemisia annua]